MSKIRTIIANSLYGKRFTAIVSGALLPGLLCQRTSAAADTCAVHTTAGSTGSRIFLIENELEGKGIDTALVSDRQAQFIVALPGDLINARIADGEDIAKGDKLTSNGDGTLKKLTNEATETLVAVALEANDQSVEVPLSNLCLVEIC